MKKILAFLKRGEPPAPPNEDPYRQRRRELAQQYLRGSGIEVGALHQPLAVPARARVRYVDRMPIDQLRLQYPELANLPLTPVDVIDNGETLATFAPASQDFVIASHFLEHAQDPIGTLKNLLRVVRPGGVLYLAVPIRHLTFDRDRAPTPWEHLVRDHLEGPEWSYADHLYEWAALVDKTTGAALEAEIAHLRRINYSIHFHVWNEAEFRVILDNALSQFQLPAQLEYFGTNSFEIICILRKPRLSVYEKCRGPRRGWSPPPPGPPPPPPPRSPFHYGIACNMRLVAPFSLRKPGSCRTRPHSGASKG